MRNFGPHVASGKHRIEFALAQPGGVWYVIYEYARDTVVCVGSTFRNEIQGLDLDRPGT